MTFMPRVQTFGRQAVRIEARPGSYLDLDMIRAHAPAVFAEQPHESRSERFAHIPTHEMLAALMKEGFMPTGIRVGGSKDASKRAFTKHMIRLRRIEAFEQRKVGDVFPEVVLKNGHDGTSQYCLMIGLFRLICMNGMITPESLFGDIKVPHRGDAMQKVIEASYQVLDHTTAVLDNVENMRAVKMAPEESAIFARHALRLRFDEAVPEALMAEPTRILHARRPEDRQPDLWTTFNRAQENLTKGGIEFYREQGEGRERKLVRQTVRPVQSVDGDIKLNRVLWSLAEEMRKLKA